MSSLTIEYAATASPLIYEGFTYTFDRQGGSLKRVLIFEVRLRLRKSTV
jgi:hypothetical protein